MEAFGAKVTLLEGIEICRDMPRKNQSVKLLYAQPVANPDNYLVALQNYRPEYGVIRRVASLICKCLWEPPVP